MRPSSAPTVASFVTRPVDGGAVGAPQPRARDSQAHLAGGTAHSAVRYINDPWDGSVQKSYDTLTRIYETIDNKTEFWILHR
jgi:hypothetical protein